MEKKDTRSGFGQDLVNWAKHTNVVALCADLTGSLKMNAFADAHPERFGKVRSKYDGAAGMTIGGKFLSLEHLLALYGRVCDQVRQSIA